MISEIYTHSIYYVMLVLFALFIALIISNLKSLQSEFRGIRRRTWIILGAIFAAGLVVRLFVFPHFHIMYIDEPWYLEMGKNMNLGKGPVVCEYSPDESCFAPFKPPLWPFLLSFCQRVHLGNVLPLFLNSIISAFSVLLVFLLGFRLFGEKAGLFSAAMLSISDIHLLWGNTAESNAFSAALVIISAILLVIYQRRQSTGILLSFFGSSVLMVLARFETVGIFLAMLIILVFKNRYWIPMAAIFPFIFFQTSLYRTFRHHIDYGSYLLNIEFLSFSWALILLAVFAIFWSNDKTRHVWILFVASLLVYVPLLKENESRMAIVPLIFLLILASYAIAKLWKSAPALTYVLAALIVLLSSMNLFAMYQEIPLKYAYQIEETKAVREIALPEDSYLVAAFPSVYLSVSEAKAVSINNADSVAGEKYFFFDGFCTQRKIATCSQMDGICLTYLKSHDFQLVKKLGRNYYLYRIV